MKKDDQYIHLSEADAGRARSDLRESKAKWYVAALFLGFCPVAIVFAERLDATTTVTCMILTGIGALTCLFAADYKRYDACTLEELDADGYAEAAKLARCSKQAATALRLWLVQGAFLSLRDLDELQDLAAEDQLLDSKNAVTTAVAAPAAIQGIEYGRQA